MVRALDNISNLVNYGISMVKRVAQAYIIELSINKNLKLEKGKKKNSSAV